MVTEAEVGAFLVQAKVCKTAPTGLAGFIAMALDSLESRTGHSPFFAASSPSTRSFDPPLDGQLNLRCGAVSIDSVTIGVSSTSTGTLLVQDEGYALWPDAAVDKGKPVERIDLFSVVYGNPRSVVVVGRWGRMGEEHRSYPAGKQAVTMKAAALALEWALGQPGEASSLKQGPVTIDFDRAEGSSRKEAWGKAFDEFCKSSRRTVV